MLGRLNVLCTLRLPEPFVPLRTQTLGGPLETGTKPTLDSDPVVPLAKTLLIAVLGAGLCQCASGPAASTHVTVSRGHGAVVAYQRAALPSMSVVNRSSLTPADAAKARQQDHGLKIIPDDQVQALCDKLDEVQFFDLAAAERDPGARHWVLVQHRGVTYVLSNTQTRTADEAARFVQSIQAFTTIYNTNDNFAGSKMTAADLKRASDEINAGSKSIDPNRVREKRGKSRHP
jgi:hypothetical protein